MDLTDLISPNNYVGQNFPLGMAPAADGGSDPVAKLRQLLGIGGDEGSLPPNAQPTAGQLAPDASADGGARTRQPLSIPLPQARPADAPAAAPLVSPSAIASFAPTDVQRAQMGMAPIPQTSADLVSAITGRAQQGPTVNKLLATLGGGLSTVEGNTAGGAFARAMGGGLKAGNEADKTNSDDAIKHLKAAIEAQQTGNKDAYTKALTAYYGVLTKQKQQEAASLGAKTAAASAAPASSSKKAGKPDEISFNGDGTQAAPYEPRTKDDYDQIESGSYYVVNGQLRRKK